MIRFCDECGKISQALIIQKMIDKSTNTKFKVRG